MKEHKDYRTAIGRLKELYKECYEDGYNDGFRESCNVLEDSISKKFVSDVLLQAIANSNEKGEMKTARALTNVKKLIDGATPVKSVRKGSWEEKYSEDVVSSWPKKRFYCSECGDWQSYGRSKFCPNCGADMRKEKG